MKKRLYYSYFGAIPDLYEVAGNMMDHHIYSSLFMALAISFVKRIISRLMASYV